MLKYTALALCAAASIYTNADITRLNCVQTGSNEYKLTYVLTGKTHKVAIFASADADHFDTATALATTNNSTITLHAGTPGQRMYFLLKADTGEQREVSIRHLQLEGTPNFRDLGGYETSDGRFVRWGLIYRSGVLTYLTPADYEYLGHAGIRVICDFRTPQENTASPETWIPNADVQHLSLPIGGDGKKQDVTAGMRQLLQDNPSPEQLRGWMTKTYANFAFSAAPQYAQLFAQLKTGSLPLLYHCTAGKDRTGVFSAFLLLTLGVPEQTVLEDYALTNKYLAEASPEALKKMMAASGNSSNFMSKLTPEQQKAMMAADPEYLRGTLRAIDERYGSFDNYRRQELRVSDSDVETLKSRLLTQ
ncbi:MAG TPA: tyrosine-protein phosphatase [Pseudacidobacterium sp.]|jgi:protein-tyrosine phosphatase|nr:tyrosine-protein phosphatase [Pseudacidobacterium sp.]